MWLQNITTNSLTDMKKQSAGILLYKLVRNELQVLLVHPGGPFWSKKDEGAWTIPKGEFDDGEEPLSAAIREFKEETGVSLEGEFLLLSPVKQKSGKLIHAWALQGDMDPTKINSNTFDIEWPPRSGKTKSFPEVDKAEWFSAKNAMSKINPAQVSLITELADKYFKK